ncbi:UBC-like protein [Flagelloscypha sp. PMI_526]|nr:UBC-like protein [Flagelloscypha sp. PMI_526]
MAPLAPFPLDVTPKKPRAPTKQPTSLIDTISPVTRTAIALEYASLRNQKHCPLGMYVLPLKENILEWDCILFVHQGYYANAILKFKLLFPTDYPERPPGVQFITDVFHPLVGQDGRFSYGPRLRPWRPKEHHAFDVLHWIKACFKKQALDELKEEQCLNKEAYRYHTALQSFSALATQTTSLSQSEPALYDPDYPPMGGGTRNGLFFKRISPEALAKTRTALGLRDWTVDEP